MSAAQRPRTTVTNHEGDVTFWTTRTTRECLEELSSYLSPGNPVQPLPLWWDYHKVYGLLYEAMITCPEPLEYDEPGYAWRRSDSGERAAS